MEKKNYVKPIMSVVELKRRAPLLLFSGETTYIPNMGNEDLDKLA